EETDKFTSLNPAKPRFVAGVLGPTRYVCSNDSANSFRFALKSFEELKESYLPQVQGLVDGRVDILLVETIFSADNVRAALSALNELGNNSYPICLSATIIPKFNNKDIENLINELINLSNGYNVFCIGLNCSTECENRNNLLKKIEDETGLLASIHPSAGLPDRNGKYPVSPEMFTNSIKQLADQNLVNIVGGCCGTTPEYIKMLSEII
ncbi:MAG: homocysteine S-methyltransferase family protein, partial [bacterium]